MFPKFDAWQATNPEKDFNQYVDARSTAFGQRKAKRQARAACEAELVRKKQARTLLAQGLFLAEFALCGNVLRSALAAGVGGRQRIYEWIEKDAQFKRLYEQAHEDALDRLEEEARRRAVDGVVEPVVSAGKLVTTVTKYSDALLATLLKGKRPDIFRERHEVTGKDGRPLLTPETARRLSDDELDAALMALVAKETAARG